MWKTVAGFSFLVVAMVVTAGLVAKSFHPYAQPVLIPHTIPVAPDVKVESKYAFHYFGASWCAPCVRMKVGTLANPDVKKALDAKFGFNQAIYDIDNVPGLMNSLHIDLVPTYFIYDGEKIIKRNSGYLSPKAFLEWIK